MSAAPRILVNRRPRTGLLPTVARSLALFVALPVLALFVTAAGVGDGGSGSLAHLVRTVLPGYLLTTAALVIIVLAISLAIGVRCAWLVAAYDFPGRGALSVALVLPLAMPAFVMAYAYTDLLDTTGPVQAALRAWTGWHVRDYWFPDVRSVGGAGVFLALALYPYIYLMARTAFAERPAALEEAGLSLGTSRARLWWQVVLPVARPAIVAGAALVLMETLADFGVVTYFAVDTFTAGIYRAWQGLGDKVAAARLALVLLAFVGVIAWLERAQRGRMGFAVRARRHPGRRKLRGAPAIRATLTCMLAPLLGFVVPALLLVQGWLADGHPVDPRLAQWVFNTLRLASIGAVVTVALGLVAAYAMRTRPGLSTRAAVALASGGYALPGIVLGIGLLLVAGVFDRWVWQPIFGQALLAGSIVALVYAYAVRFFSVAYQGLEAGLQRIGRNMDDSARSLGRSPLGLLREVHWPILRRSLALTGLLVMIDCLKELPATLVLRPFDTDTLAVIAYQFAADERLSQAALPSLMIVVVGVLPVWLLSRTALRG